MVEELMGAYGGRLVVAILGVAVGLACLVGVLWLVRGRRGPSPFVRGGKNRQPRLQVLDAAAVDTRRRLVLVRRDDTEHLIMIGGPTDIVIESGISTGAKPAAIPVEEALAVARVAAQPERQGPRTPVAAVTPTRRAEPATPAAPEVDEPQRRPPPIAAVDAPPRRPPQPPASEIQQAPVAVKMPEPGTSAMNAPVPLPVAPQPRNEPVLNDAADILEAARTRVFQGPTVPVRTPPPDLIIPAGDSPKALGSDFERVLEEEMASNLAAREAVVAAPQRPADKPPVAGATPEPSLQAEVARIFGEMSVTRDK